jgi:ribonuclease HI
VPTSTTEVSVAVPATTGGIEGFADWFSTNITNTLTPGRRRKKKKTPSTTTSSSSKKNKTTSTATSLSTVPLSRRNHMPSPKHEREVAIGVGGGKRGRSKLYAVAIGRQPGIYNTWADCELQVKGFSSAKYKSFYTQEEAQMFIGLQPQQQQQQSNCHDVATRIGNGSLGAPAATVSSYLQRKTVPLILEATSVPSNPYQYDSHSADAPYDQSSQAVRSTTTTLADTGDSHQKGEDEAPSRKRVKQDSQMPSDLQQFQPNDPNAVESKSSALVSRIPNRLWFHINFDGGTRGNPHGDSGCGTVIVTRSMYATGPGTDSNEVSSKGPLSTPIPTGRRAATMARHRHSTSAVNTNNRSNNNSRIERTTTKIRTYLGVGETNNQAEYTGAIIGLEHVVDVLGKMNNSSAAKMVDVTVVLQGDSDLVIRQLKGLYKCNSPKLKPLLQKAQRRVTDIERLSKSLDITYEHVYRRDNSEADGKIVLLCCCYCCY